MPSRLSSLCAALAGATGHPMEPQAAIVNYYHPKSTMGGHVDDAELDLSLPLVSLSLGLSAVFLCGGRTRDVAPTALWLRSGDAVIATAPARLCYHGVPRIMAGTSPGFLTDAESYTRLLNAPGSESFRDCSDIAETAAVTAEFMGASRLNVNVRQVVSERCGFTDGEASVLGNQSMRGASQSMGGE